jgi:hypothetical protein
MVRYGTSAVKEKVMAATSMSKRRQEGRDETAVRERILKGGVCGVHEERLRNDQHA